MKKVVLIQLPIPQLSFGAKTANIPLGAACLKNAASDSFAQIEIIPESLSSYLSDEALICLIKSHKPDLIGFTVYSWNIDRSMFMAQRLRELTGASIVFGGPEITRDNNRIRLNVADHLVYGEGEMAFRELLSGKGLMDAGVCAKKGFSLFEKMPSPYLSGFLEPEIEDMMFLETQRGCPYSCGYCYYSKSRKKMAYADQDLLVKGFEWALSKGISEVFLLDPSLDARKDLNKLLKAFADVNKDRKIRLSSEIRADMISAEMADLLDESGFSNFEIGLQTINPEALRVMNRKTDLAKFVKGVEFLKERGIVPSIDLIIGLPGDSPEGFKKSVDFVHKHSFHDDIQIFPLSVLPGTDFRLRSQELGLLYEPDPPYTIISTNEFSNEDVMECLDYAEGAFDVSIYPMPDIDISWHLGDREFIDRQVNLRGRDYVWKLILDEKRSLDSIREISSRLTHPYQILVAPSAKNIEKVLSSISILTEANPFTPFDLVFFDNVKLPEPYEIERCCRLFRPHFLDNDLRFLYQDAGRRAYTVTSVTRGNTGFEAVPMHRNVFLWDKSNLPADLDGFDDFDGVLIDAREPWQKVHDWQDHFFRLSGEMPSISFSDMNHQRRWVLLTNPGGYSAHILNHAF